MTTAREQARKAAREVFEDKREHVRQHNENNPNLQIELRVTQGDYADAVSDVWEPIVRDLLLHVEDHPDDCGVWHVWGEVKDDACSCGKNAAVNRAKEALGE